MSLIFLASISLSLFSIVSCCLRFYPSSVNVLHTLYKQTQAHRYRLPHPPVLHHLPFLFFTFPPLLPVYGSTSQLSSVMSLGCLLTHLWRQTYIAVIWSYRAWRAWRNVPLTIIQPGWKNGVRDEERKGFPLIKTTPN